MGFLKIPNAGSVGVLKDLSVHELPPNAWTDASNIRFLDGYASQFLGHGQVYDTPSNTPQHVIPLYISGAKYWIYLTAANAYCVTITGGVAVHTDLTHATPLTGTVNAWTSTLLSGIPIINAGNTTNKPAYWDLNTANNFVDLTAFPANTYCKSLRAYKNYLIALNVTKTTTNYPFMVKWSHAADVGALPSSWDHTDATKDAGEFDLADGGDPIVDGLTLRDSFMIYKENSCWRMDYVGGAFVFRFQKVLGLTGAMNRNCIVEVDGFHVVLTGNDVVVHDGQTSTSVLDKQARRDLFLDIDATYQHLCFVFKNPYFNEVFICYPSIGSTVCNKAVVWNYKDKTVSYRTLPSVNHAASGAVDNSLVATWAADSAPWSSDLTLWDGGDFVPNTARVIMATSDTKLFLLDSSAAFDGSLPTSYLERKGLSLGAAEKRKLVTRIRPRITGNTGETVTVSVAGMTDPYATPTYTNMTYTIGSTVSCNCLVSGRYLAVKFSSGTAYSWRLDSYDLEVTECGDW